MPKLNSNLDNVVNERLASMAPSMIMQYAMKFAKMQNLISLTIGEPDFNVADHVKKAAIKSINDNKSHYSLGPGIIELRQAIAKYLNERFGLNYDPQTELCVTVGVTEAIYVTLATIINPGDKVIVPTPTFTLYESSIELLGGIPVEVDTSKDDFRLTGKKLQEVIDREGQDKVKALIINYPGNPTGVEYTREELQELVDVVTDKPMYIISDEIYAELTYGVKHTSLAKLLPDQTILLNGVSKANAMTGYRVGYIAAPAEIAQSIVKMNSFLIMAASNPAQYAAAEAIANGEPDVIKMRDTYRKRRDYIIEQLHRLGYELTTPEGAFYVFPKIPARFHMKSEEFANKLADDYGVGVIPGIAFGPGGDNHVRMSYATSMDNIKEAMHRLAAFTADMDK